MEINITIDEEFRPCVAESWLKNLAQKILTMQGIGPEAEMGLVITGQRQVQELNCQYRKRDEPTDVLSFALQEGENGEGRFIMPPDKVQHLGEVIISYPQTVTQAREHEHSAQKEITILLIHGILHLLGYDHEEPEMEKVMRAREAEILPLVRQEQT